MFTLAWLADDAVAVACCATSSAGTNSSAVVRMDAFMFPPVGRDESSCRTARRSDNEPRRLSPEVVVDRDDAVGNAPGGTIHAKRVAVFAGRNAKIHVPHAVFSARG